MQDIPLKYPDLQVIDHRNDDTERENQSLGKPRFL